MHVHLKTLGCRLNEAELESWVRDFQSRGHSITDRLTDADLVVVNTCAVTGEAMRKSRKLMHRVQRDNPSAKLVVSGCFASLDPTQNAQSLGVDLLIPNQEKDHLVEIASRELDLHAMPELATLPGSNSLLASGRQRAFIKIQDGCRYQCTFCVVTLARGDEKSKPEDHIIREINILQQQGVQEAVLTGVHLGGYGSDSNSDLSRLVSSILSETDIPRLRLGAVEPWDLPDNFWSLFHNRRFMPHLHLPLQSGSDSVLKRMARRCKSAEFQRLVEQARAEVPDFNLSTDIIVGFPGETEREWQQTLDLVERIGFGHLHIFGYSPRPGTRAARLPDAIPKAVIRARSQQLHQIGKQMKKELLERYLGRQFPVLIESDQSAEGALPAGYTPNFLRVLIEKAQSAGDLTNNIRTVRCRELSAEGDALIGEVVDRPSSASPRMAS
ncbi:MAG: tRNA (N(6)-L-threonylcarbamoyladenosine(37)-C(2))-methylthiotransferase MtaB [Gammaproteobacteria bacterium]|nr:tRNA (N(6)-L-threonylcarbamoyladenosine(37)-C(2))-methylthiotransferase MtaB [Gammaproteobacteria bacterium]MCB1851133.1 tRNA (N(6)-L-threonylcarbamoyladenosine(37)-C(2))-methylthiotransferase MtaB [Gammaproteobacteria bacterium]MCP5416788.1 tRNA (N(6)-L-threonylcarbamoyladenosine(37)-C(2))-methylthiotransferase MtaB [Chromatiaceae bacterium]